MRERGAEVEQLHLLPELGRLCLISMRIERLSCILPQGWRGRSKGSSSILPHQSSWD